MKTFSLKTTYKKLLADTVTPVSIFLKIRDKYANSLLLESSDYHSNENSYSYICFAPLARFEVKDQKIIKQLPDGSVEKHDIQERTEVLNRFNDFIKSFDTESTNLPFINNGLFGYMSYDAVRYFEDIEIEDFQTDERKIPEILYSVYQFVVAINHFKNELFIFEHSYDSPKGLSEIENIISNKNFASFRFYTEGEETSNLKDEDYLEIVKKCKEHCIKEDVHQVVPSRRFSQAFQGDEFNVYRALRSINPSPYLFYYDYGSFKIFGSSPEAQIVVKNGQASIHPIAGTIKRTGDDNRDADLAKELFDDPKENSEHEMLVDLARNDLSRHGKNVKLETFKEIQFYSHVIHLVSRVTGELNGANSSLQLVADTFPAGTLSGAPKHMAMRLINQYEKGNRGYYGGAIGYMGFNGDFNHAIMIRSLLSKNNKLFYQAGSGVVAESEELSELNDVNNKLLALRTAIKKGEEI